MATADLIPSFPPHEDRVAFGHWLSGFTDGEGSFVLSFARCDPPSSGLINPRASFVLQLRADDAPILRTIQSYFGCGFLQNVRGNVTPGRNNKPQVGFKVGRCEDLVRFVIPHFVAFPLRAKKAGDFAVWRQGVELASEVTSVPRKLLGQRKGSQRRWTDDHIARFRAFHDALRAARAFKD